MAQFSAVMNGGPNMWAITSEERTKHDKQFDSLRPAGGHITGDQARGFFLQSGLPASVLAEIWTLSDLNKDGKMDQQEFSIAMKLIKLTLQGQRLPPSLPPVMKQPPVFSPLASARFGMGSMPNLSVPPPGPPAAPLAPGSSRPSAASLPPLVMPAPLVPSVSTSSLPNGTAALLQPLAAPFSSATLPHTPSYGLLMGSFGAPSIQKAQSLIDLGSSSSTSSTASLTGGSPKAGASDWAVPQPSRLKYRQKFNSLDKGMTGYLSGLQARNALLQSNLSQTQLATIWNLADVDGDGQLKAEEFILAMHLTDMARAGQPLPLTLPPELVPPSFRGGRPGDSLNGAQPCCERPQEEPPQKKLPVTFEDKRKANYERGNLELEKRRQVLLEQQQREAERKAQKEKEELERKQRLLQEQEWRRQRELEKQRELERQREEERRKELDRREAAKQELERQRRLEWERIRRQELLSQRNREQEEIVRLQTRKKGLHLELEALGGKQQQISGRLEDLRLRKQSRRSELEALDRQCDLGVAEIRELQQQLQESQKQLVFLVPEKQRLQEKAEHLQPDSSATPGVGAVQQKSAEKEGLCRRLKEQLDALERDTAAKLSEMDAFNSELKCVTMDDCVLRCLLSLLSCLHHLFLLLKELRENYNTQQLALEQLNHIKREKLREMERKRAEAEAARKAKQDKENLWRESLKEEEEEKQRHLGREQSGQELPREPLSRASDPGKSAGWESYRALYPFEARSHDEMSFNAGDVVQVDAKSTGEPGWLYGRFQGRCGWFPGNYVERLSAGEKPASPKKASLPPAASPECRPSGQPAADTDYQNVPFSALSAEASRQKKSAFTRTLSPGSASPVHGQGQAAESLKAQALCSWTAKKENHLNFSKHDVITVLEQQENWWFGAAHGRSGWFPKSYVRLVAGPDARREEPEAVYASVQRKPSSAVPVLGEEYVALYSYSSSEPGDLTFAEGQEILVTQRDGEWWTGTAEGRAGIFPSNYVRPKEPEGPGSAGRAGAPSRKPEIARVTSAYAASGAEQLSLSPGQLILILKKNASGWWQGELQARGKKRQKGWFPASHVKLLGPSGERGTAAPQPVCQVIAMYDYAASNEDELSFSKGQLISVLSRDDADWWHGELGAACGLFPANYVKMTTDSDPSQQ